MNNKVFYLTVAFIFITTIAEAKISQKKYFSIFQKYNVSDNNTVQGIINTCVDKFGKNNIKIETNNSGEKIINHKNEKEFLNCTYQNILKVIRPIQGINTLKQKQLEKFLLENEIYINFGKGKETYIFKPDGYEKFKDGKKIGNDGWRWSKLKQLRVFMDGEKTTWRVSGDKMALSIKKGKDKPQYYFLEYKDKKKAEEDRKIAKKKAEERKKAEAKRKEEEKKKAEEKKIAEEKRIAEEKAAEEKRIAEEKAAEEKRIAEEKKKEEEIQKKLKLVSTKSEIEIAQEFMKNTKEFIKDNSDEFDIVQLSEFFIKLKPIDDGQFDENLKNSFVQFKKFTNQSQKFTDYMSSLAKNEREEKIQTVDKTIAELKANISKIEMIIVKNPSSAYLGEWAATLKEAKKILNDLSSMEEIKIAIDNLKILIDKQNEIEIVKKEEEENNKKIKIEADDTVKQLKNYLKDYITSDLAPSLLEQIKNLENTIKSDDIKQIQTKTNVAQSFLEEKILAPIKKAEEEKRLAEEKKIAEEKRIAEEKKAEEERKLAEEKIKNRFQEAECSDLQKWAKKQEITYGFTKSKILSVTNLKEISSTREMLRCNAVADLDAAENEPLKMKAFNENGKTWYSIEAGAWLGNIYNGKSKVYSISDVMLDKSRLFGEEIIIEGHYISLGELSFIYQEKGSTAGITVDAENLNRDKRKYLLTFCGSGCTIKMQGLLGENFGLNFTAYNIFD